MINETLASSELSRLSRINHVFFTKDWGNAGFSHNALSEDCYPARAQMASFLGLKVDKLFTCRQIHSSCVVQIDENSNFKTFPEADGMVTKAKGIALGILTADCVPILFADQKVDVIGAAHAGWRGALEGILENTVAAMVALGAQKSTLLAALGPSIWQKSYEVGPEFVQAFLNENISIKIFFIPSSKVGRSLFDLPGYVCQKLKNIGVVNVKNSLADTCAEPHRFYSHRYSTLAGEERKGNLLSAIMLKDRP